MEWNVGIETGRLPDFGTWNVCVVERKDLADLVRSFSRQPAYAKEHVKMKHLI